MTNYPETGRKAPASAETLLLANVRPYGEGEPTNILLANGEIAAIGSAAGDNVDGAIDRTIDGAGRVLLPGLVDMHVHLREPGREDTETIETGSKAAAKGGFTAVFTMANTSPVMDQPVIAESVWAKAQGLGLCDVHPVGSITTASKAKTSQNLE